MVTCLLSQEELVYIPIQDNLRLQILPSVEYLPNCQRHQNAAFIRDQQLLVVWADNVDAAEERAESYLRQIVQVFSKGFEYDEKSKDQDIFVTEMPVDSEDGSSGVADLEEEVQEPARRPVLIQAMLTGCTLFLIIAAIGTGWRQIALEVDVDKNYIRCAFIFAAPFQIWLALVRYHSVSSYAHILINLTLVLHAIGRRLYRPIDWPNATNACKLEVLLWDQG